MDYSYIARKFAIMSLTTALIGWDKRSSMPTDAQRGQIFLESIKSVVLCRPKSEEGKKLRSVALQDAGNRVRAAVYEEWNLFDCLNAIHHWQLKHGQATGLLENYTEFDAMIRDTAYQLFMKWEMQYEIDRYFLMAVKAGYRAVSRTPDIALEDFRKEIQRAFLEDALS